MCVCVFIKLHITAQSGPVILVILCHSHVCVCVVSPFILDARLVDAPAGVRQDFSTFRVLLELLLMAVLHVIILNSIVLRTLII